MLTAEQRQIRRTGIGSSDIAAIVGEDPMKSALDVWLEKTGRVSNDNTTDQAEWGHLVEPVIAERFAMKHGVKLERSKTTIRHPKHAFAVATPDRRIVETGEYLEAKNVGYRMMRRWRTAAPGVYVAPSYVQIQGQWQCLVGGAPAVWIAAQLGGRDPYEDRFAPDVELADALLDIAARFWRDFVEADRQPEPDHTARARELLERIHPTGVGLIEPTSEIEAQARIYAEARAAEKAAKQRKDAAGNMLRALVGDATGTDEAPWGRVLWADVKGRTNWKGLATELGATEEQIARHAGKASRSLRVDVDEFDEDEES